MGRFYSNVCEFDAIHLLLFLGASNSKINQSISITRGIRVQDIRAREEARQPNHLHHVLADHQLFNFNAAILFPLRIHQVRDV